MKSKLVSILSAFAILAMAAVPAAADTGIFAGTASVSDGTPVDDSCIAPGAGLGLLSAGTFAWEIDAPGTVRSTTYGVTNPGDLYMCGTLNPGLAGLGASCITTSSNDGEGYASFNNGADEVTLENVGWLFTAGGTFVVSGDAAGGSGNLNAVVQTFDDQVVAKCITGAATQFLVQAVYSY